MQPALDSPHLFFRRIIIDAAPRECQVAMEDEHHYFILRFGHDGERITSVDSHSRRTPWTICPQAASRLQEFVGQPLCRRLPVGMQEIDAKQQCTHQYDLAMLALVQAGQPGRREYVSRVVGAMHEYRHAQLWLNDRLLLDWRLKGTLIHSSDEFDQQDLRQIMPWAEANLSDAQLEALFVQRRSVMVAASKGYNLDLIQNAGQAMRMRGGACFVFQPERADQAIRVVGSTRQDVKGSDDLLMEFAQD